MGNRAVIKVEGSKTGIYLHWNGGRESVNAFLRAAKDLGVRSPVGDTSYFYARLTQIIGNFFGGAISLGVDSVDKLDTDNGDNGTFVVGPDFKIVRTLYHRHHGGMPTKETTDYEEGVYQDVMRINKPLFERNG